MENFFTMGGYAAYIWPAYGATAAILIGLLAASWRNLRSREAELRQAEAAAPPRRPRTRA